MPGGREELVVEAQNGNNCEHVIDFESIEEIARSERGRFMRVYVCEIDRECVSE